MPNGKFDINYRDDDQPYTREEIDYILKMMDEIIPMQMTDEELEAWEADRKAQKEWEKAHFHEYAEKLEKMWQ